MREDRPRMSDIARALDISNVSVSRALSGQDGVSEELRTRILLKASEMGYLRPRSASRILVLHQKPYIQDRSNYSYMVQGVEKALQAVACQYSMEFVGGDRQNELYLPSSVAKGTAFDGVIFVGRFEERYMRFLTSKIRNQVLYSGYSPSMDCDAVWYNFNNGAYRQCSYLIENGHRTIGFIGNHRSFAAKEKILGVVSALEDHGLPVRNELFLCAEEEFEEKAAALVRGKDAPTAVVCQSDYAAMRFIKCLHEAGVRVPEDVSVIGSGNNEMSPLFIPALTTMELYIDYAAECTVELLLKRIGNPGKPCENIQIGSTLVERNSVRRLDGAGRR